MQDASLLAFILNFREFDRQEAVFEPGAAAMGVHRRKDLDLADEAAVATLHAMELDALRDRHGRALHPRQRDPRPAHLHAEIGRAEARDLDEDQDRVRRLDDVHARLPLADGQMAVADLHRLLEESVELGLKAGDEMQGGESGGHGHASLSVGSKGVSTSMNAPTSSNRR